jgi:hypothetical protein
MINPITTVIQILELEVPQVKQILSSGIKIFPGE